MRVLELSQRFPPALGGVERTLEELVVRLTRAGVDVEVFTTDLERNRPFARRRFPPSPLGVAVRRFRAVRALPLPLGLGVVAPGMLTAALTEDVDLVHAHAFGYYPCWVGATVRRVGRVPLVVTPHFDRGRGTWVSSAYHRAVVRGSLLPADRVIVQSHVEADLLRRLGLPEEKLVQIPTGVAMEEFAWERSAPQDGPLRLLSVGRLDLEQKGLTELVHAVAELPPAVRSHVEFVGDDWGGARVLRELADRLGVGSRVTIHASVPRDAVLEAYRHADVLVLASRFESFPRVILEGMAAGLPIVASRVGGVPELVEEGRNALLVPPNDPKALAHAIRDLAQDPDRRAQFGRASRRRAELYDWSRLLPRYVALFRELTA